MKREVPITVVITTYNEQDLIENCLLSARNLTDKIIVVDTESTDNTRSIVKKMGIPLYSFPHKMVVEPSRNYAISLVESGWVFILDADERISEELAHEVLSVIKDDAYSYCKIPRLNIFAGKWRLNYGGWSPDYVIRLIKKASFVNWPDAIHSTPVIDGRVGFLKSPLLHYSQGNLSGMVEKTILFENVESNLLHKARREANTPIFFRKFLAEFYRRAIKNMGLLDGPAGLIASFYQAYSKTITYLMLYEKNFNH